MRWYCCRRQGYRKKAKGDGIKTQPWPGVEAHHRQGSPKEWTPKTITGSQHPAWVNRHKSSTPDNDQRDRPEDEEHHAEGDRLGRFARSQRAVTSGDKVQAK